MAHGEGGSVMAHGEEPQKELLKRMDMVEVKLKKLRDRIKSGSKVDIVDIEALNIQLTVLGGTGASW